jgi:hypothetical protein
MALIIEDGSGLPDAQSYVSVDEADAYLTARGKFDAWDEFDADEKGAFLVRAADYLGQAYRLGWAGNRRTAHQSLDWPRYAVPQIDAPTFIYDVFYDPAVIPREVKNAQIEAAFRFLSGELAPDQSAPVIERTIGPITTKYAEGARQSPTFPVIDRMLAPFLTNRGSMSARVIRT